MARRTLVVGLLVALSLVSFAGMGGLARAKAGKAARASVALPGENNITVAQLKVTARSRARLKGQPKVKVRNAGQLPSGVTVIAGLGKFSKRNSAEGYVVIVKPQGSISAAPASLLPLEEQAAQLSITGRAPLRAKTETATDIITNDRSSSPACGGLTKTRVRLRNRAGSGDTSGILGLTRRRCRGEPPFTVKLSSESWTHHKPTEGETLVCALVTTEPTQGGAENHAFLGRDTALGIPTIADGAGTLNASGTQKISFAVQLPGLYYISVWVRGAGGIAQSAKTTVVVLPPDINGPTEC